MTESSPASVAGSAPPEPAPEQGLTVSRDFLVRVDSYCSLVAHRGWGVDWPDGETRQQLIRLSLEARSTYEGRS